MSQKATSERFLAQIDRLIDWVALASSIQPAGSAGHAARSTAVVKMLLLARWYGMSDAALLEACRDRISFRRFLGLPLNDNADDDVLGDAFRRQAMRAPMESENLIHAIEAQLLAGGLRIRPGMWAEVMPVPVSARPAGDDNRFAETAVFAAGVIEDLKKRDESLLARGGAMLFAKNLPDRTDSVVLQPPAEPDAAPVQASADWPWGATTELGERLIVGRDRQFCPYATELATYPHVSRRHAELSVCPMGVWVRDLHSRNGTFIDDQRLGEGSAQLVDSDARIRFGPHCMVQLRLRQ